MSGDSGHEGSSTSERLTRERTEVVVFGVYHAGRTNVRRGKRGLEKDDIGGAEASSGVQTDSTEGGHQKSVLEAER